MFFLGISILVQSLFLNASFHEIVGEFVCIIIGTIALMGGCIVKGVWDSFTTPSMKTYLITSLIVAVTVLIILSIKGVTASKRIEILLPSIIIQATITFAATFVPMAVTGTIIKRRMVKLEKEYAEKE